jgi:predicted small secreted protein
MKKVALTVAVLALGLAACGTKTENAADNAAAENAVETDANAAMTVDNALDAAGNEVSNAGEAVENAGEAVENAAGNAAH